jgi:2,3-bisphosphoglycerate-dependent phosphoglycerate mutase
MLKINRKLFNNNNNNRNLIYRSFAKYINFEDDGYTYRNRTVLDNFLDRFRERKMPGTLILVRHGESEWNAQKRFTGWTDVDLSERGTREVEHAARLLLERGFTIDITYTSVLKRAIRSSWIILRELQQVYRPMIKSWRLNERMYGALEGLSKPELANALGEDLVQKWRAGLLEKPPPMTQDHVLWHGHERKYKGIDKKLLPSTESLQDTIDRTIPLWESQILPDLKAGRNVMIVAHANSLRGLIKHIDNIDTAGIQKVGIPNGIPLVYKFDINMKPLIQKKAVAPLSGAYLEKRGLLREALAREEEHANYVESYDERTAKGYYNASPTTLLVKSLSKLDQQRKLLQLFAEHNLMSNSATETHGRIAVSRLSDDDYQSQVDMYSKVETNKEEAPAIGKTKKRLTVADIEGPLMIIIRHGKTEHNKLGLFTGWDDAPLASEGRAEALLAGRILREHNVGLDVIYTSWLSRAIETAWLVMNELDSLWLPIVKTWRLNERMYGDLEGKSKPGLALELGKEIVQEWRSGFSIRPPPMTSDHKYWHGNEKKYSDLSSDEIPVTESLEDTMERTLPLLQSKILPNLKQGKNVMIVAHGNSLRGIVKHIDGLTSEEIQKIGIPNGIPLLFKFDENMKPIRQAGAEGRLSGELQLY